MKYFKYLLIILIIPIYFLIEFFNIMLFEILDDLITLLSILTGFYLTCLSIIATSNFSKILYNIEDPNDNSKTYLHNLIYSFTNSIMFSIFLIIIIVFQMLKFNIIICDVLIIRALVDSVITFLFFTVIIKLYSLIRLLENYIIKSASKKQ